MLAAEQTRICVRPHTVADAKCKSNAYLFCDTHAVIDTGANARSTSTLNLTRVQDRRALLRGDQT